MQIISASTKDADVLTELTMRSKAHWGYSGQQMETWREELTITQDYLSKQPAFVLIDGEEIRGYYSFEVISKTKVELDNLFVDPDFIGNGLGKLLISDFLIRMEEMGMEEIVLDADPNAETFYSKYGFQVVGKLGSSIPGRYLPVMKYELHH